MYAYIAKSVLFVKNKWVELLIIIWCVWASSVLMKISNSQVTSVEVFELQKEIESTNNELKSIKFEIEMLRSEIKWAKR